MGLGPCLGRGHLLRSPVQSQCLLKASACICRLSPKARVHCHEVDTGCSLEVQRLACSMPTAAVAGCTHGSQSPSLHWRCRHGTEVRKMATCPQIRAWHMCMCICQGLFLHVRLCCILSPLESAVAALGSLRVCALQMAREGQTCYCMSLWDHCPQGSAEHMDRCFSTRGSSIVKLCPPCDGYSVCRTSGFYGVCNALSWQ